MTNDQTRPFREVTAAEAVALAREGYRVIDVREQSEWDSGHVAGATLLPLGDVPHAHRRGRARQGFAAAAALRGRRPFRARRRAADRDGLHERGQHEGADRPVEGAGR